MKTFRLIDLDKTARVCCRTAAAYPYAISAASGTTSVNPSSAVARFLTETADWSQTMWDAASLSCAMHGISETLCYLLTEHAGAGCNIPFFNRLSAQLAHNTQRVARQTTEALQLAHALAEKQIDVIALKGLPNSCSLYHHPSHRPMTDVDLLVHSSELIQAVKCMTQVGHQVSGRTERHFELCPVGNADYPHLWSDHPDNRRGVDVHHRLYYQPMQVTVECHAGAWQRSQTITIQGTPLKQLAPVDAIVLASLEACANLFTRRLRMIKLMDILMLVNQLSEPTTLIDFILHHRPHTALYCYPALALTGELFQDSRCKTVAAALAARATPALRQLIDTTDPMDFSYVNPSPPTLGKFEGFRLSHGISAKQAVLSMLLIPARQWASDAFFTGGKRPWLKHYSSIIKKFFITLTNRGKPGKATDGVLRLANFE